MRNDSQRGTIMHFYPELMRLNNGQPVVTQQLMETRRAEILEIFQKYAYGDMPAAVPVSGTLLETTGRCCSGTAVYNKIQINCDFGNGKTFQYPIQLIVPEKAGKKPLILCISFSDAIPNEYIPSEEIIDNAFALAVLYYKDVTSDANDFTDKLAAFYPRTGSGRDPAKISLWAWSASRALDYLLTRDDIDPNHVGVIGHSRLGKTALWCAANDTRIRYVCSNDSGCMGAAYARTWIDGAESTASIAKVFPFWFCDNFQTIANDPSSMPFDQHLLLAAIAPRNVLVNSASKDHWAGPASEQDSCVGASPAWKLFDRITGFLGKIEHYGVDQGNIKGEIGYYKRYGIHFLGRKDWLNFMEFINNHY